VRPLRRLLTRALDLVDRTWPRLPLGLLALAGLVVVLSVATAPEDPPAEQATEALDDTTSAAADRDGERVCAGLSAAFRGRIERRIPGMPCEEYVRSFGIDTPGRVLRDAPRDPAQVDGDRGQVALPTIGLRADLVREGGAWKVTAFTPIPQRPRPGG
jgi:hypothetical protein